MPRIVRCSLIQTTSAEPAESPLEKIKKAMIEKHVGLIRKAAQTARRSFACRRFSNGPYFCAEQSITVGTRSPSRFPMARRSS